MNISSNHHSHRSSSFGSGRGSQITNEQIQHRVMKSVSDYNRQLNQERKDDRRVCMDLQTYTIQYPVGLGRDNIGLRRWIRRRRRISPLWRNSRRYPVALIPNQYQDWFLQYTPQELKYLPLNTVIHGPIINDYEKLPLMSANNTNKSINNTNQQQQNGNNSDSDIDDLSDVLSDWDDDSTCSCGEVHCSPATNQDQSDKQTNINDNNNVNNNDENAPPTSSFIINDNSSLSQPSNLFPTNSNNNSSTTIGEKSSDLSSSMSFCKICKKNIENIEEALCCADCGVTSHPSCLEIGGELLSAIRLYRWQCQDCKSCNQCGHPHDEEKMMFCDKCDRGYHTYCVGLEHIPQGHWVCSLCAVCANCGTLNPMVKDDTNNEQQNDSQKQQPWQHELIKLHMPDGQTIIRHMVLCNSCYQLRKL